MNVNTIAASTCLSLLLVGLSPVMAADAKTVESVTGKRVAEMFDIGYARGPRAMQDAKRIHDSLQRDTANDARVDYAYGLVLQKLLRHKEAKAEFLLATKRPGTPYLPVWQAVIWSDFVAKEFEDGLDRVVAFVKLTHNSDGIAEEERRDAIFWVGRVMAAQELALDSNQNRETWMQADSRLADLLNGEQLDAYNGGKGDVLARHALLEDEIREVREKDKERQAAQQEKKLNRLGKSLDSANNKRETLKKTAAEMKDEFDENTAAFKKLMDRAEKDYAFQERRGMTSMAGMLTIDQQINGLNQNRFASTAAQGFQRLTALQNQRQLLETDFQLATLSAQQVSLRAQKMTEERADYVSQYQKATGDIVKEDADLEKWKDRTQKQAAEVKKAEKKPKGPATAVTAKVQAATAFRTYVDLDLIAERDKVLLSYGTTDTK